MPADCDLRNGDVVKIVQPLPRDRISGREYRRIHIRAGEAGIGLSGEGAHRELTWIPLAPAAVRCGFCVYCIVAAIGHVSGAHINPAVSLALLISKQFTPLKALIYVVAQCTGAVLGAWLPEAFVPPGRQISGYIRHHHEVTLAQAFGIEVFNTFVLVFVALGSIDTHYHPYDPSWGLSIGLWVTVAIVTGADLSGTMLNPCISFGRSFIAGQWEHSWLYWVGPIAGACLATFVYHYIVRQGGTPIETKENGVLGEDTGSNKEHHHGNWVADEFISRHVIFRFSVQQVQDFASPIVIKHIAHK
ncbi:aquaporin AQPAe.a-like [Lingula anatina]|uniref:Aquaporin AQPAe.a-like n=1 Tax=Lingula anatina TaxID=7574 RepID=A0A1S3JLM1_LINAN|nr:aquaporin AQPAe.a-like [Lingula anatina]|eukprot:XP_013411272.1 aquaporin AQPAe.a-like [Lingula anatina]